MTLEGGPPLAIEALAPDASIVWDAGAQEGPPHPRLDLRALGRDHVEVELLALSVELGSATANWSCSSRSTPAA